jgi:hypothetical protein
MADARKKVQRKSHSANKYKGNTAGESAEQMSLRGEFQDFDDYDYYNSVYYQYGLIGGNQWNY